MKPGKTFCLLRNAYYDGPTKTSPIAKLVDTPLFKVQEDASMVVDSRLFVEALGWLMIFISISAHIYFLIRITLAISTKFFFSSVPLNYQVSFNVGDILNIDMYPQISSIT